MSTCNHHRVHHRLHHPSPHHLHHVRGPQDQIRAEDEGHGKEVETAWAVNPNLSF